MISALQKYFCVLQFSKTESVISVLRAFQRRFGIAAPRTFVDSTNNLRIQAAGVKGETCAYRRL